MCRARGPSSHATEASRALAALGRSWAFGSTQPESDRMRWLTRLLLATALPVVAPGAQQPPARADTAADTAGVTWAESVGRARAFLARGRESHELLLDRPVTAVLDGDLWRVTFHHVYWRTRRPAVAMAAVDRRGGAVRRVPLR
jgi:hypothetical protein